MGFGGDMEKLVGIEFDDIVVVLFWIWKGVGKMFCEVNFIRYCNNGCFFVCVMKFLLSWNRMKWGCS